MCVSCSCSPTGAIGTLCSSIEVVVQALGLDACTTQQVVTNDECLLVDDEFVFSALRSTESHSSPLVGVMMRLGLGILLTPMEVAVLWVVLYLRTPHLLP